MCQPFVEENRWMSPIPIARAVAGGPSSICLSSTLAITGNELDAQFGSSFKLNEWTRTKYVNSPKSSHFQWPLVFQITQLVLCVKWPSSKLSQSSVPNRGEWDSKKSDIEKGGAMIAMCTSEMNWSSNARERAVVGRRLLGHRWMW